MVRLFKPREQDIMLLIRLRSLSTLLIFSFGVMLGYQTLSPWLCFWYTNRLVILTESMPTSSILNENHKSRNATGQMIQLRNYQRPARSGRIFCMVLTQLEGAKAYQIYDTWGRRCDYVLFVASQHLAGLPTVVVPPSINNSRESLWKKVVYGLSRAYDFHTKADWFLKTDDDTYVVVDNLRSLLARYNSSDPLYLGGKFQMSYMSGGAGYVISKRTLQMFHKGIRPGTRNRRCRIEISSYEDFNMGACLRGMRVHQIDTRDIFGRERFLAILPFKDGTFVPGHLSHDCWYWMKMYYPVGDWFDCCAESAISFHYADPQVMAVIDFFLYELSPCLR